AFITGASRGIGQEIAVAFAEAGADLALAARSEDGLAATAEKAAGYGREALVIPADVTDQEAVAGAVATAIERLGHVDIVVNNAGGGHFMGPVLYHPGPGGGQVQRRHPPPPRVRGRPAAPPPGQRGPAPGAHRARGRPPAARAQRSWPPTGRRRPG